MPQLPNQGETKRYTLPSSATLPPEQQAYVVLQGGRILGGDLSNVDDPESKLGVAIAILAGRIKEWNFTEADGKPTPITLDNVKRLELEDLYFLFEQLDLKNVAATMSAEEKKSSSPTSGLVQTA